MLCGVQNTRATVHQPFSLYYGWQGQVGIFARRQWREPPYALRGLETPAGHCTSPLASIMAGKANVAGW